ncbi:MAG: hypothetical protein JZU63_12925, partial [Rhodoferax sp.]|nr:hypothetical protein [Rhodoferax sp.]
MDKKFPAHRFLIKYTPETEGNYAYEYTEGEPVTDPGAVAITWDLENWHQKPPYRGAVEFLGEGGIGGWCFDVRDVARPVPLHLIFGNL